MTRDKDGISVEFTSNPREIDVRFETDACAAWWKRLNKRDREVVKVVSRFAVSLHRYRRKYYVVSNGTCARIASFKVSVKRRSARRGATSVSGAEIDIM